MNIRTFRHAITAAAISVAGLSTAAHAATVLDVTQYNGVVLGNYSAPYGDVEGAFAVAGNASFENFGIGDKLTGGAPATGGLVVGGNLTATNGQLHYGNMVVGGNVNTTRFNVKEGVTDTDTSYDFATLAQQLRDTSKSLSEYDNTGETRFQYNQLTLTGTEANLNVFSIDAAQLGSANSLSINVANGSQVLVNVVGSSANWSNMGISLSGVTTQNVLFNFHEASSLSMAGISISGSVLAPNANVLFQNGHINGILITNNLTGPGELHNTGYKGGLLTPTPSTGPIAPGVPEPATWAMMLLGFAVVGGAMRKRRNTPTVSYS